MNSLEPEPTLYLKVSGSSLIDYWTYNQRDRDLTIVFKGANGKSPKYTYKDVPEDVVSGLMVAESAGKFFSKNISRQFRHIKVV